MLFYVVLLASLSQCSADRQAAADAIQQSIFGKKTAIQVDDVQIEPVIAEMVYSHDHRENARYKAKASKKVHEEPAQLAKTSYSFAELSGMSVKQAPKQRGSFYRPENYERLPVIEPCQAVQCHLNLAVIMDSSGSVGYQDYQLELSFVKTLLEILAIKAHDAGVTVCTGIVSYSTRVRVEVDPCCVNSFCSVVDRFRERRLNYIAGSTNTNGALKVARQMLQAAASYKKVALLITDGKSNTGGSPISFARKMREEDGIDIVALGVTRYVNERELKGISGLEFVTRIDVFDEFHELATILLEANSVGSEYELETDFEEMCFEDDSTFQLECEREEVTDEDDEEQCAWGAWSNCVRKRNNRCFQTRTCKMDGGVTETEKRDCECAEASNFMAAMRVKQPQRGMLGHPRMRQRPF